MKKFLYLLIFIFLSIPVMLFAQEKSLLSEPREDLQRFTGLYGDPEEKNETRRLWIMISCDGYLVSGALWGDVAPWWMTSEAENIFTYADSFFKLRLEFETDSDGKIKAMIHDFTGIKSPLKLLAPVPEEWGPCLERPKR